MKITVNQAVLNMTGEPVKEQGSEDNLTYRTLFYAALNQFLPNETPPPTSEVKAKCYNIIRKLFKSDEVNLTSDEAALIKERVGKIFNPLLFGRTAELLDGVEPGDENTTEDQ